MSRQLRRQQRRVRDHHAARVGNGGVARARAVAERARARPVVAVQPRRAPIGAYELLERLGGRLLAVLREELRAEIVDKVFRRQCINILLKAAQAHQRFKQCSEI